MMDYGSWEPEYLEFRKGAAEMLTKAIPADLHALRWEAEKLEPLRFEAERHRAAGAGYYYAAKLQAWEAFREEGLAVSSLDSASKAKACRSLWFMEDSLGLCSAVTSRQIRVSTLLRLEENHD